MATETSTSSSESGRAGLKRNAKYYILSYPLAWLVFVFLVPLGMLFMFSFWVHVPGTGYEPGSRWRTTRASSRASTSTSCG